LKIAADGTTLQIDVAPFFKIPIENKTLLLLPAHSSTTVGELAARAKTNSQKNSCGSPRKISNFKFPRSWHQEDYYLVV
jgi:hypothetical protein